MQEKTVTAVFNATQSIEAEVGKVIIGKNDVIRKVLMSILAGGHVLLDDVPGVGKTSLAVALGKSLGLSYNRIQCTPDVLPSDIVGFSVFNKDKDSFTYMPGIINNTNLLLADEINRTSSRTQAALLEAMEENVYLAEFHAGKGHMEQMAELDNQFHNILYDACGSKMLEHQLIDYHSYVMRIRKKTLSTIERSTASNKEHRAIMEAIRAGKADLAERLASEHMKNAYENMVKNRLYDIYKESED